MLYDLRPLIMYVFGVHALTANLVIARGGSHGDGTALVMQLLAKYVAGSLVMEALLMGALLAEALAKALVVEPLGRWEP